MKSTVNTSLTLTRHSETGNTVTTMSFIDGMPPVLRLEQNNKAGFRQVIEITMPEIDIFDYALGEARRIHNMVETMDDEDGKKKKHGLSRLISGDDYD